MVLGAFTIINTIGILGGLPLTISTQNNDIDKEINNNFSYCFDSSNNFDNSYSIILDFKENVTSLSQMAINVYYNNVNYIYHFSTFLNNNYMVFTFNSTDTYITANSINLDFTSTSFGVNSYTLNNVYIAKNTSQLSPIGGDSIIQSITSGLGLMDDITKQFVSGFSNLIWDSSKNQLTTFGNFALIFLGVSITFSIVKLCMFLIRSKTGS